MRHDDVGIKTTTVGSYPVPAWLAAYPTEQGVIDATRVVLDTQRHAGIDLPTDGELYRFDVNHPDTNGMIDYFIAPLGGVRTTIGWSDRHEFSTKRGMAFRAKPAGVVEGPIEEGGLDLVSAYRRTRSVATGPVKLTVTSPYMLARTLLDRHYGDIDPLVDAIAGVLARQIGEIDAACVQVDEANVPGNPEGAPVAARGINILLDAVRGVKAVHFCFGNYGGQTIQAGEWSRLVGFLNQLRCDHLVLEIAHRPESDLDALRDIDDRIDLGIGVIDIKVNHVETADEVARRIDHAISVVGEGRVRWVHPDCGFWMLKRSIADRKIAALVEGLRTFLGTGSA